MTSIRNSAPRLLAVFALALVLSAVSPVSAETPPAGGPAPTQKTAVIDLNASQILWTGKKVTGQHNGTVKIKDAKLEVSGTDVAKAEFEIDLTTIRVEDIKDEGSNAKLTEHLKSEDFFAVDKHPVAVFKSTKVKSLPNPQPGQPTHEVTGDLTIKGITKPITFPMTVKMDGSKATASASIPIDRTLWNIRYRSGKFIQGLGDKLIDDLFTVDVKLVANL